MLILTNFTGYVSILTSYVQGLVKIWDNDAHDGTYGKEICVVRLSV